MSSISPQTSTLSLEEKNAMRKSAQIAFDRRVSQRVRNERGQFSTPSQLAIAMLSLTKELFPQEFSVRFLDPALGTGVFFYALLKVYGIESVTSAVGFESDVELASIATELWSPAGLTVNTIDFTTAIPPEVESQKPNLIVCNPPYVRHQHLNREFKQRLKQSADRAGLALNGLAGLYTYFLILADQWLTAGGNAIWIVPAEFLDVNYGSTLRRYFAKKVTTHVMHRFAPEDAQFEDALVTSVIIAFRNEPPSAHHKIRFSSGSDLLSPNVSHYLPAHDLDPKKKWRQLFESPAASELIGREHALADWFFIKRGLATGANNFFVMERIKAEQLGLPPEFLRPILPSPRLITSSVIEADSHGFAKDLPQLVLLDCPLPLSEIADRFPRLHDYLRTGELKGVLNGYLTRCRSPWYKQERRPPAPILCTYMSRRRSDGKVFRFFHNCSEATALNVYLMLYPKPVLAAAMRTDMGLLDRIIEYLQSAESVEDAGRVYGGGLSKMEPRELGTLRLPDDLVAAIRLASQTTEANLSAYQASLI